MEGRNSATTASTGMLHESSLRPPGNPVKEETWREVRNPVWVRASYRGRARHPALCGGYRVLAILALPALISAGAPHTRSGADIQIRIDSNRSRAPISPLIYGTNAPDWKGSSKYLTLTRIGGNRMTAYNWETNASNAGSDYHFQNDGFLGGDDIAGEAERKPAAEALAAGASVIVTVPIAGYVSADKNGDGDVRKTPDYLETRFLKSLPRKNAPFVYPPDTRDRFVYQDEFVSFMEHALPGAHRRNHPAIFYCLDNEPGIWSGTHAEIHPHPLTYAELMERSLAFGSAVKAVAPRALLFGPVSYGWNGFETLQSAPDRNGRNFVDFYLTGMRDAAQRSGRRLLDVFDIHWYPEARGGGVRITEASAAPDVASARVQAPRSLWDPAYREDSWIVNAIHEPIRLLPRLKEQIARDYPGTRLSISEYNYGGGGDISGAIAEADVLGIFGRQGLFAAALWPSGGREPFTDGGFAMYRDYDGSGGRFGATSVAAETSDIARSSVYASVDSQGAPRMTIVAINRTGQPLSADLSIRSRNRFTRMEVYQLTADSSVPRSAGAQDIPSSGPVRCTLPPMSVSTLVLRR